MSETAESAPVQSGQYAGQRDAQGRLLPGYALNPHGRPATPDRYTRKAIQARLEELGIDIVNEFVTMYRDPKSTQYTKLECLKELSAITVPKLKHVELTDPDGEKATIRISWDNGPDAAKGQFTDAMQQAEAKIIDAVAEDEP